MQSGCHSCSYGDFFYLFLPLEAVFDLFILLPHLHPHFFLLLSSVHIQPVSEGHRRSLIHGGRSGFGLYSGKNLILWWFWSLKSVKSPSAAQPSRWVTSPRPWSRGNEASFTGPSGFLSLISATICCYGDVQFEDVTVTSEHRELSWTARAGRCHTLPGSLWKKVTL